LCFFAPRRGFSPSPWPWWPVEMHKGLEVPRK
jgi:hypothetical protein